MTIKWAESEIVSCDMCGKQFMTAKSPYPPFNAHYFCSDECANKAYQQEPKPPEDT